MIVRIDKKYIKRHRKQLTVSLIILLLGCTLGGGLFYFKNANIGNEQNAIQQYHDRSHDTVLITQTNARLDSAMKESMDLLSPQLASFGLGTPRASKSECFEGDPALYKYACWTRIDLKDSGQAQVLGTAESAAQKLIDFNALMVKRGWKITHNDFRNQPSAAASEQWPAAIAQYPVDVSYINANGECSVEFYLRLANQPDYGGGAGSLSCATTLLPGFYY